GGTVEAAARPGTDRYVVRAEGYPKASGSVRHDEEGVPVQTIRLRRGTTVIGRAVRGSEPVAGVDVSIVQGTLSDFGGAQPRFSARNSSRQSGWTDASGRFEFTGLHRTRHRVTLAPEDGPPVVVDIPKLPKRGETLDLGDVDLAGGGLIDGVVVLPQGVDREGISLCLDQWRDGPLAITDGDGRFVFEGVAAREHEFLVLGKRSGIGRGRAGTVAVEDGVTTSIELDLTSFLTIDVELHVEMGGAPAAGLRVQLVSVEEGEERKGRDGGIAITPSARLGTTDETGTARGEALPLGPCRVRISGADLGQIEHPTARIDLVAGRSVAASVRFEIGSLALDLSAALPLPEDGKLHVRLTSPARPDRVIRRTIPIVEGAVDPSSQAFAHLDGGLLVLTHLPAGRVDWSVSAIATGAEFVWTEQPDGSRRGGVERAFEHAGTTTVEVDWRATVTVP
ncbi:MAG: hypothetical protein AAGB93_23035, partial [Planctomycetota bacterium]